MKKNFTLYLALVAGLVLSFQSFAQNSGVVVNLVENNEDAVEIIENTLLAPITDLGTISNITYVGSSMAIASFSNAQEIGIPSGMILSTGKAKDVFSINNSPSKGSSLNSPGDAILADLVGNNITHDASCIEFDFIPNDGVTEIRFEMIFGSEEYHEYVSKMAQRDDPQVNLYNDAFGFFVTGSDINGDFQNGALNIATVPFQADYISVGSVNCGYESKFKVTPPGKINPVFGSNCSMLIHNDNLDIEYSTFDAYTKPLMIHANLTPGLQYHFKIVIADARDGAYDSGLLFRINNAATNDAFKPTGLGEVNMENQIQLSPNPAVDFTSIQLPNTFKQASLKVYDMQGKIVSERSVVGGEKVKLQINDIPSGMYTVIVEGKSDQVYTAKLQIR
ncbi:MAG: choice-of-anchor L domain-containing protein [Bacteroidales bacterium]